MQFRERLRQVLVIKESPHRIALAFAVGIFIGMSPRLGVPTVLGLAVAWIFKLNRLVTLVGVYVTNPWTIVPIYTFGTWVGAKVLRIDDIIPDIDWTNVTFVGIFRDFSPLILPFITGTTLLGVISAIISYAAIYRMVKAGRE